jgi:hypothetical protein
LLGEVSQLDVPLKALIRAEIDTAVFAEFNALGVAQVFGAAIPGRDYEAQDRRAAPPLGR